MWCVAITKSIRPREALSSREDENVAWMMEAARGRPFEALGIGRCEGPPRPGNVPGR